MKPAASVIVTTYNRPDYLEIVLASLALQTNGDFEVIVGDDGSTPETAALISRVSKSVPYALKHFWQPDEGFRVGAARNGAMRLAESDWFLFLDGDIVAHPRFVEAHLRMSAPKRVLFGGRVKLTEAFSKTLSPGQILKEGIETVYRRHYATCREERYSPVTEGFGDDFGGRLVQRHGGHYRPSWSSAINLFSCVVSRNAFQSLCFKSGSNFSADRSLMEAVNGFDARFNGLSGEDGELFWRLLYAGAEPRSVLFSAIAYHLWHRDNWERAGEARKKVLAMEAETRKTRKVRCESGLAQGA